MLKKHKTAGVFKKLKQVCRLRFKTPGGTALFK